MIRRRGHYGLDGSFELASAPLQVAFWTAVMAGLAGFTARGLVRRRPLQALLPGLALTGLSATAAFYLQFSLAGKFAVWERLLDELDLKGDERILDLGCGRGAVLCAAARRVPQGHAAGVDIWRLDQSGNSAAETLRNAGREGVAGRVWLLTADMTHLPFPDASFDVVVSSLAVHNLPGDKARRAVLEEVARVLRPGGRAVLADLFFTGRYARRLQALGLADVHRRNAGWRMWFGPFLPTHIVSARRPSTR